MATEITINFIWVDNNNDWQIPEDWDPHLYDEPVSVNLNEVARYWSDDQNLNDIAKEIIPPLEFLTDPYFESHYLSEILEGELSATKRIELLPLEWIELGSSLRLLNIDPPVIAVPHGMTPWAWYDLTEDEKLSQMGLAESDFLRADGVLYSDFNTFYFDTYRFGSFCFELIEDEEIESILMNHKFLLYAQEVLNRGPDSRFHNMCDDKCGFQSCSRIIQFPASIQLA